MHIYIYIYIYLYIYIYIYSVAILAQARLTPLAKWLRSFSSGWLSRWAARADMPHRHSTAAKERRRDRARALGLLRPCAAGHSFLLVREDLKPRIQAMAASIAMHEGHAGCRQTFPLRPTSLVGSFIVARCSTTRSRSSQDG